MRLRQARAAAAGPAVATRGVVEPPCVDGVRARSFEEDDVMDDRRTLWLDHCTRYVRVLGQVRLEHETVVVVEPADRPFREIRPRGSKRHRCPRRLASTAHGLDGAALADLSAAANPPCEELLLAGSEYSLGLAE